MSNFLDLSMMGGRLERHERARMQPDFQAARLQPAQHPRVVIVKGPKAAFLPRAQWKSAPGQWWHHAISADSVTVKDLARLYYIGEDPMTKVNLFATTEDNATGPQLQKVEWALAKDNYVLEMPRHEQAAFGLALSLVRWHGSNGYCAKCAAPTDPTKDVGFSRTCIKCRRQHFPQIMPAVLMTVLDGKGNVILSQRRKKSKLLTVLSGFMLQGESAEETVRREVAEETGAKVTTVRYVGSQPFPYPYLVMLCYYAVAPDALKLVLEKEELEKVVWVSKEDVRKAFAQGHPDFELHGPGTTPYAMLKPWVDGEVDDRGKVVKKGSKL